MDTTTLFQPQISVTIGKYIFTQGIGIEVHSARASRTDWARIRFTSELPSELSISRMETASIQLGYNGTLETVFEGFVAVPFSAADGANEITLTDASIKLSNTIITETFLDTTPQEIISYMLAQSGISSAILSDNDFPALKRVGIYQRLALGVIDDVHTAWAINYPAFFRGGTFYWGALPKQAAIYTFEYGVNIISLNRVNGMWELETLSAPFIRHSDQIKIIHPQATGTFTVSSVTFRTNEDGFIRTSICFA